MTGAAGGIGSATCRLFAERGWDAVGVDLDPGAAGGAPVTVADLRDPEAVKALFADLPRVDALVNNAAVDARLPLSPFDGDRWREVFSINLEAAAQASAAALPMLSEAGGAVVNVASVHALATVPGAAAYASSKAALVGFTRAAAIELGPSGVRVNAVLPGAVDTPMLLSNATRDGRREALGELAAGIPLRRIGRPEEIAESIAFLADGERSSFITGQSLVADGGVLARLATM